RSGRVSGEAADLQHHHLGAFDNIVVRVAAAPQTDFSATSRDLSPTVHRQRPLDYFVHRERSAVSGVANRGGAVVKLTTGVDDTVAAGKPVQVGRGHHGPAPRGQVLREHLLQGVVQFSRVHEV